MPNEKITLTPKQEAYLIRHYRNTKNDVLMEKTGLKFSTFHRFVRQLGLKKTKRFMKKVQREAAAAAAASHLKNGTYPPKGYRIPRSEEFQFKPGESPVDRIGKRRERKRIEKAHASLRETRRLEKARATFGLPRQTKLRVVRRPRYYALQRLYLRKLGYIVERGGFDVYWTDDTKRSADYETRTRENCKKFTPFHFRHISEKEA